MNLGQLSLPQITRPPQVHSRGQSPSCPTGSGNELQATARAILAWFLSGSPGPCREPENVCSVAKTLGRGAEVASCVCWIIRSLPSFLWPFPTQSSHPGLLLSVPCLFQGLPLNPTYFRRPHYSLKALGQDPTCRVTSPLGK